MGAWEDAFATFCRALAGNGALRQLDLRNNQISHKGAEELALALTRNASLQQLGEASVHWPSPEGLRSGAVACCSLVPPAASVLFWKQVGGKVLGGGARFAGLLLSWRPQGVPFPQRKHPRPGQPSPGACGDSGFPSRPALE